MSRLSYRWELASASCMPMALACVEGGTIGVIARKAFDANDFVIALLTAAPALSQLTSFLWAQALQGLDRVRAIVTIQLYILLCVAVIALAPISAIGQGLIVAAVLAARCAMAGIMVARADVWRANYPRTARARVTGRLSMVMTLIIGTSALAVGAIMDIPALGIDGFRIFYAAATIMGLVGVWAFSHIRWRGRTAHLTTERNNHDDAQAQATPRAMLGILRSDSAYRRYMSAQFVLGFSNLAAPAPFIIALTSEFDPSYTEALLLTQVLPMLIPLVAIPFWARLLDGMHIVRFRVYHSWTFVLANTLMFLAFLLDSFALMFVARTILGVGFGGGMLAWNLGHHDFATRETAGIYMGIHATLTGVRGALGPFIGVLLYSGATIGIGATIVHLPPIGAYTFGVLAAASAVGAIMFARLYRQLRDDLFTPHVSGS